MHHHRIPVTFTTNVPFKDDDGKMVKKAVWYATYTAKNKATCKYCKKKK